MLASRLPSLPKDSIIIPLPTISSHIRKRGLDHTYLLAKQMSKLCHCRTEQLLLRNSNSVQVGADRKTRLTQAKTAYIINPKSSINPASTYLLLDDIWTTGASMKAAIELLKTAGAQKIAVAVLAISDFKN
jgi:predicted amidophosphoribosyltransferase